MVMSEIHVHGSKVDNDDREWGWQMDPDHSIVITHCGVVVMRISMLEAIETAGRDFVVEHVKECDKSEWLKEWQEAKKQEILKILTR